MLKSSRKSLKFLQTSSQLLLRRQLAQQSKRQGHSLSTIPEHVVAHLTKDQVEVIKTADKLYKQNHIPLSHASLRSNGAPYTDTKALEAINLFRQEPVKTASDTLAINVMKLLRVFTHAFFRDKYVHHAVVLETVAAVPGMVGGMWRHFTSLRYMRRDYGKIGTLIEEAENERMHLLTWMQIAKPSVIERLLVILAQFGFTTFYSVIYIMFPQFAHRLVGFLEEEAYDQYSKLLESMDKGIIKNQPAPEIAKKYWNLAPDATLRDVVLCIRADEAQHRDYNHYAANKLRVGVKE